MSIDKEGSTKDELNREDFSLSPNELVRNYVIASDNTELNFSTKETTNTRNDHVGKFNRVFNLLISPKDDKIKARFFGDRANNPSTGELIKFKIYHSALTILFFIFGLYRIFESFIHTIKLRFLNIAYNPNSDPSVINADVNKLAKIPRHLSSILVYKSEQEEGGGLEGLCSEASQFIAWSLSSGIPLVSIFEYNGILKRNIPQLRRSIYKNLINYFGTDNIPKFCIKIPHLNITYEGSYDGEYKENKEKNFDIEISLLSYVDGRPTLIELTKVLSELARNGEIKASDITVTFIDSELKQLVGDEPDLIIAFQPYLNLAGYPPWHIRLTEMYWEPDNEEVTYAVYLRALTNYSKSKVNIGR